jgi:hypothetical protein
MAKVTTINLITSNRAKSHGFPSTFNPGKEAQIASGRRSHNFRETGHTTFLASAMSSNKKLYYL